MIELHSPDTEAELLLLRSVFDAADICYFVHNDTFGSMVAGPRIAHYNRKRVLVHEADYEEAQALLGDLLRRTAPATAAPVATRYRLRDKLRMVAEFLVFGWFLPGRRHRPGPRLRLVKGFRTEE